MKETMINISEAKAHFSAYAKRVKNGERIILCDRNKPFGEFRPLAENDQPQRRPFGLAKGLFEVPDDFNAPDPEIEKLFNSGDFQ